MEHNINVEIYEDKNFKKIWCSEGHYMTNWDKENIEQFTYSRVIYAPIITNMDDLYCITDEECLKLQEEQRIYIENKNKEN